MVAFVPPPANTINMQTFYLLYYDKISMINIIYTNIVAILFYSSCLFWLNSRAFLVLYIGGIGTTVALFMSTTGK